MSSSFLALDLNQALRQKGCPICGVGDISGERYLKYFLHENVNSMSTRLLLQKSKGFCSKHALQLFAMETADYDGDCLGNAIIAEWLLQNASKMALEIKEILSSETNVPKRRSGKAERSGVSAQLRKTGECPACSASKHSQLYSLEVLIEGLGDKDFFNKYRQSDGLCLAHFSAALELGSEKELLMTLIDDQVERMHKVIVNLNRYTDKHDYQNTEPYTVEENRAVADALHFLAGLKRG